MKCFRHYEPSLRDLISDDLLGLMLARQGVSPARFERMMMEAAERLAGATTPERVCSGDCRWKSAPAGRWTVD